MLLQPNSLTGIIIYFVFSVFNFHTTPDIQMIDEDLADKLTDLYLENRSFSDKDENEDDDIDADKRSSKLDGLSR